LSAPDNVGFVFENGQFFGRFVFPERCRRSSCGWSAEAFKDRGAIRSWIEGIVGRNRMFWNLEGKFAFVSWIWRPISHGPFEMGSLATKIAHAQLRKETSKINRTLHGEGFAVAANAGAVRMVPLNDSWLRRM
jgi:hypothetical protein